MPKVNVYLPDELAEAVKDAGLPVSSICQRALEVAVRRVATIRESAKLDLTEDNPTARLANFTAKARTALNNGIQLARQHGLAQVGSQHLLLGILDEGTNLAIQVLRALDIEPDDLREELAAPVSTGEKTAGESTTRKLDEHTSAALKAALGEAISMGHNYIGCEHLLLGLIIEPDGVAGGLLRSRGAESRLARRTVQATLSGFVYARSQSTDKQPGADALREALAEIGQRLDRLEERLDGSAEGKS
jgi:ATP-dependent Clp protease ATP-binding subunit ClpA/post-segregation antitoxin (ccd killing protein)